MIVPTSALSVIWYFPAAVDFCLRFTQVFPCPDKCETAPSLLARSTGLPSDSGQAAACHQGPGCPPAKGGLGGPGCHCSVCHRMAADTQKKRNSTLTLEHLFPGKPEELAVITVLKSLSKSKSSTNIASWASS